MTYTEASCVGQQFRLSINDQGAVMSLAQSSFVGCTKLASALQGRSFPTGKSVTTLSGGPTVSAQCNGNVLAIRIRSNDGTSSSSLMLKNPQACSEIRDVINQAGI